jgi:uncharacterized protein
MPEKKYTNPLIHESSPYLLQHAHNPVNWNAWNDKALGEAKMHDKLLLISIGYAACHWCHVMEYESFEDEEVARIMNTHFINIKVDREERPDIDQIYMDACQLINGNGGWPLNAIALPDGRPIFAGTYFKKHDWIKLLQYFGDIYPLRKTELEERATQIQQGISSFDAIELNLSEPEFSADDMHKTWQNWKHKIDFSAGGRIGAPKFPMPCNWEYLLRYYRHSGNEDALKAVISTLDNMMMGGIYDQVGGGFARYSVDGIWKVPHFEKMLYDNGQLVSLYSMAYAATGNETYKEVVDETINWLEREMHDKSGGFYAALDADSEGVEGKFYVWEAEELDELLGENAPILKKYWSVESYGNWEEGNILWMQQSVDEFCEKESLNKENFSKILVRAKSLLLAARDKRIRPGLDDKILTSWNALMLKGLADAYRYTENEKYLRLALDNAAFIEKNILQEDGRILRNFKNGRATINGFLDDYSFTSEAFIALYQITGNEHWLSLSLKMVKYAITHFFNPDTGMFYYTSGLDRPLAVRKTETSDNVIPSSNSSIAKALFMLSLYYGMDEFEKMAVQMLHNMKDNVIQHGSFYSNWAILIDMMVNAPVEVAVSGPDAFNVSKQLQKHFLPRVIFAASDKKSKLPLLLNRYHTDTTMIYVCKNKACNMPVKSVESALDQISQY